MSLKIVKRCKNCTKHCKQQVDETVWENADILMCPSGKHFKKRRKKRDKK